MVNNLIRYLDPAVWRKTVYDTMGLIVYAVVLLLSTAMGVYGATGYLLEFLEQGPNTFGQSLLPGYHILLLMLVSMVCLLIKPEITRENNRKAGIDRLRRRIDPASSRGSNS